MVKERYPRSKPGSIHSPVVFMKDIIECARKTGNIDRIQYMLAQLRTAWKTANDYERSELLWLGTRYRAALNEINGGTNE